MTRAGALIVLLLAQALLAGCGFHLRGSDVAGAAGTLVLRLDDGTRSGTVTQWQGDGPDALRQAVAASLVEAGVRLADDAPMRLVLVEESVDRRVVSVARTAGAGEYQFDYTLTWRATGADGATLVPSTKARADSSYRYKANAIMGSAEEESLILRELRRDAARQVVRALRIALAARGAGTDGTTHAPVP